MNRSLYLAVFLLLFSCKENNTSPTTLSSKEDSISEVKDADSLPEPLKELKDIEDIRKEHAYLTSKIENGRMDSLSFNYNCREEIQGKVTYYSEKGQLRVIKHRYNEYSHFSATDTYFLKDGKPFFVLQDQLSWSFVDAEQTKDDITEKRVYIIDNQPVHCLQKKFSVLSGAVDPPQSDKVSNEKIACGSLQPLFDDLEVLYVHRSQKHDNGCLEAEGEAF